ncbi:MAG: hypothetical protein LBG61_03935 [Burkholderiales bacterium]|nr:hypothetical protein [Burkholderiales bacterium]
MSDKRFTENKLCNAKKIKKGGFMDDLTDFLHSSDKNTSCPTVGLREDCLKIETVLNDCGTTRRLRDGSPFLHVLPPKSAEREPSIRKARAKARLIKNLSKKNATKADLWIARAAKTRKVCLGRRGVSQVALSRKRFGGDNRSRTFKNLIQKSFIPKNKARE